MIANIVLLRDGHIVIIIFFTEDASSGITKITRKASSWGEGMRGKGVSLSGSV